MPFARPCDICYERITNRGVTQKLCPKCYQKARERGIEKRRKMMKNKEYKYSVKRL